MQTEGKRKIVTVDTEEVMRTCGFSSEEEMGAWALFVLKWVVDQWNEGRIVAGVDMENSHMSELQIPRIRARHKPNPTH